MTERQIKRSASPGSRVRTAEPIIDEQEPLVSEAEPPKEKAPSPVARRRSSSLVSEMPSKSEKSRRGVEDQLLGYGYKPHHWIFAQDFEGREAASYILADLFGDKVLIELDSTIPRISITGRDLRVRQKLDGTVVPALSSLPSGEDLTVCGAASMGSGGFCALNRSHDSQDLEPRHFTVVAKTGEEAAVLGDPALPIPIARLSQIQANNKLVMQNIIQQTGRFRLAAIAQLEIRKLSLLHAANKLQMAIRAIANTEDGIITSTNFTLQNYFVKTHSMRSGLVHPPSAEKKDEFEKVMSYCRLCSGNFEKLVVESGYLLTLVEEINEMIADIGFMAATVKGCTQ